MDKRIIFVGNFEVEGGSVSNLAYDADASLLDADIIVFSLDLRSYHSLKTFQGLPCLDDDESFRLRRQTKHWASELTAALEHGKTVIVHLRKVGEVSIATGQMQYSGTGRNARTTRIVETFDPYSVIPVAFGTVVRRSGEVVKTATDLGILATYWHEFGAYSPYQCYIENFSGSTLLTTQTGARTVAGVLRQPSWKGILILLPPPDISAAIDARVRSLRQRNKKKGAATQTANQTAEKKAGAAVAAQYISALITLDKAARSTVEATPPPTWSQLAIYELGKEAALKGEISTNEAEIQNLQQKAKELRQALKDAQLLKALLYEKGKALEQAILSALRILGFKAEGLKESDSEFDAVLLDPSGARLIGEVEGKDDKAISVEKLDQLDRNLREDFARQDDSAAAYARGVLFGNAFRLTDPAERRDFFTAKCLVAAKRSHISLVRTTDLFAVAKYLDESPDEIFALSCRKVLLESDGEIVSFPQIPVTTAAVAVT